MNEFSKQSVLFPELFSKPTLVVFDGETQSSDGGALLLAAVEREMDLIAKLSRHIVDRRDPLRIEYTIEELFRQRAFAIAMGYADGNDAHELRRDPVLKPISGRSSISDATLGSQPTLSRFENAPTAREQVAMIRTFETEVLKRLRQTHKRPHLITIDFDGSEDRTHGQQALAFFNGHYGSWCFIPNFAFVSFDEDPELYLVHARLRPGNSPPARGAVPFLRRFVKQLKRKFPGARIRVRMDAGYATPVVFDALDRMKVEYVVAMASNSVLLAEAEPFLAQARAKASQTEQSVKVFGDFEYCSKTWNHPRRVIVKAEVVAFSGRELRDNPRFVITNLGQRPQRVYEIYCGRGNSENGIKELKLDLEIDRTSCSRFLANQFRVTMTAVAYVLYQQLRANLRRTQLQRATVGTLRHRLLKVGVRVTESVRRIVLHFPAAYAWHSLWLRLARSLSAVIT
jgi:Transposase DDE domain group 1